MIKRTPPEQNLLPGSDHLYIAQPNPAHPKRSALTRLRPLAISLLLVGACTYLYSNQSNDFSKIPDQQSYTQPSTVAVPSINPYNVSSIEDKPNSHGPQHFYLSRDKTVKDADYLKVGGNDFFDEVTVRAQLVNYQTAKIQIFQSNNYEGAYHVPQDFLADDYLKQYHEGLFFNHLGFQVNIHDKFHVRLFDRHNNLDYVTTEGEPFLVMKYFIQIGYKIESQKLFGLGERTRDFRLQEGTYILYPQKNGDRVDTGANKDPAQQVGQHPFLMAQLRDSTFFGIYFMNSNAQQISIKYFTEQVVEEGKVVTKYYSHVVFNSNGGSLDTFYFIGPTYQDVIRQYHAVIGKPVLGPIMNHGLYIQNNDRYSDETNLNSIIDFCNNNYVALEGVFIPPAKTDNQYLFNLNFQNMYRLSELQNKYPGVRWVYPFSPMISKSYTPQAMVDKNLIITVNGTYLEVADQFKFGYCFDYFNYNSTLYLDQILESAQFDFNFNGIYLFNNVPTFVSTQYDGKTLPTDVNPFRDIPFWPGQDLTYYKAMPAYAKHNIHYNGTDLRQQYHFYMHGLYASEMAKRFQFSASEKADEKEGLIISDGTFPGAGAHAIGHIFAQDTLSADSLKYSVSQILNFHMFGIPYASPNICGYARGSSFTPNDELLCLRSFQLSIVSPLAVYHTNGPDFSSLSDVGKQAVRSILEARMSLIIYQRTEMYKIQNIGGALVRPLFTEYPEHPYYTPEMVDTVMFGESLKVDFVLSNSTADKKVLIPEYSLWLEIFEYKLVYAQQGGNFVTLPTYLNYPIILQKQGTIIPLQHMVPIFGSRKTANLKSYSIRFSVLLDPDHFKASGHVLVENGKENEFYEIKANINQITIKQQNEGKITADRQNKYIDMIRVAGPHLTISNYNAACAVLNDHYTVQQLHVNSYFNDQLEITPNDPKDPLDLSYLRIDQVLFIYYGQSSDPKFECNQKLMEGRVKLDVLKGDYTRELLISQNLKQIVPSTPNLYFQVTLEDDNTLQVAWFPESQPQLKQYFKEEYGKERKNVGNPSYKLDNIVTIGEDPFYIEVHSYVEDPEKDEKTVYWTTKGSSFIFFDDYSMYSFFQPNTNPDKFFGIGERKGEFFLQDKYTYAMHTNNKNLKDIEQAKGRMQFCKNAFLPYVFAVDALNPGKMMATYLTEGSKDITFTKNFGLSRVPKVSVVQMVNYANIRIIFDQEPTQLMRDTHRNLYTPEHLSIPPTWALGQFHLVRNFEDSGEFTSHQDFYSRIGWPLEGFVLDLNFTNFESLFLSPTKIEGGNYNFTLQYLNQKNLTIWQIMKAGVPKRSQFGKNLIGNFSTIEKEPYRLLDHSPVVGLDQQGEAVYPNYYLNEHALSKYQEDAFDLYERTFIPHSYGVQLIHNEIFDPFCSSDCYRDSQYDPMPHQFVKVGVDKMLRNSLSANSQVNVDKHNGYGYRQHLTLSRQDFQQKKFFISNSMTAGSGRFGNFGRMIDYIDHEDDPQAAVIALQSLSIMGIGAVGEKYGAVDEKIGDRAVNQHIMIQTFSPLAAHQWLQTNPLSIDDIMAGPLVRYKYMLIKYTQTLLFRQTFKGDPLIHPLFFDFYNDANTFSTEVVNNQYMYGDFLVSIKANSKGDNSYYPANTWCSTLNYNSEPFCFNSTGTFTQVQQRMFFFKDGSILPLQDAFGQVYTYVKPVNTTKDLTPIPVDLHINIKTTEDGVSYARGSLLYYSDESDFDQHCYVDMTFNTDRIMFELVVGRDIGECRYAGYQAGRIYIYNPSVFKHNIAKINGDDSLLVIIRPGHNQHYKYFDLTELQANLSWYGIFLVEFQ